MVVGVTNEPKSLVTKHVESKGMEFPIAIVKTNEESAFGIRGFPSAFLLDVDGTILWKGHPGKFEREFTRKRLDEALGKTSTLPPLPDKLAASVKKYLNDRAFGKAYNAVTRSLAREPENVELSLFVESIEGLVRTRVEAAAKANDAGEYGRAFGLYSSVIDGFDGVPGCDEAEQARTHLGRDKQAKADLAAAKKWTSAMTTWREGDFEKALKAVTSISKKYRDTATGNRATKMLERHGGA
ncbi:MAG: hypothetical protein ACI8QZ_000897 [Chlamydiales bacterium]